MRIVTGLMIQESNTLAPRMADIQAFRDCMWLEGEDIISFFQGTDTEMGGVMAAARAAAAELIPTIAAKAVASGPVTKEAFDVIAGKLITGIRAAGEIDAVVLVLHGGMVVEEDDDGVGELLRRVREAIGPDLPLTTTLDLHANVTRQMVERASVLVVYQTYPHIDNHRTGALAAKLAVGMVQGEIRPTAALRRLPMILPPDNAMTTRGPAGEMREACEALEREGGAISASFCQTQPWLNIPDMRCTALVYTDDNQALADASADALAVRFWGLRHGFYDFEIVPLDEAIGRVLAGTGLFVLADAADGTGGGASGDSTAILQALVDRGADIPALLSIVDAPAVARCIETGVGESVTLEVGASIDQGHYQPCRVTGLVKTISDGRFVFKGPQLTGEEHVRGRTVVLVVGRISIVLTERTCFNWEPEFYRSLGLEPLDARIAVVKSMAAYRGAYEEIMADGFTVDTPGSCRSRIQALEPEMPLVTRPCYPFDDVTDEVALRIAREEGLTRVGEVRADEAAAVVAGSPLANVESAG